MIARALKLLCLAALLIAGASGAGAREALAPDTSPRPKPRPAAVVLEAPAAPVVAVRAVPDVRPRPRPAHILALARAVDSAVGARALVEAPGAEAAEAAVAEAAVEPPQPRPKGLKALFAKKSAAVATPDPVFGKKGAVCGRNAIKGRSVPNLVSRVKGCGIAEPVEVTSVQGIRLTAPATVDCTTAQALDDWVRKAVVPAVGTRGGGLEALLVASSYACRPRNNQAGARLSEHGKGRAIDIAAFILKDGSTITVLDGWQQKTNGKLLKAVHKAACGTFGTVLGPNSDRFHRNHFHLDTARYRGGAYCK